jgi:hypothetical protein
MITDFSSPPPPTSNYYRRQKQEKLDKNRKARPDHKTSKKLINKKLKYNNGSWEYENISGCDET